MSQTQHRPNPRGERRIPRRALLEAGAGAAALSLLGGGCGGSRERRPHVVVVVLDALRASSLRFHGHPRSTAPFLEQLAARSLVFEQCSASALWTRPAVTGLLSGLSPMEHRNWDFGKAFPPGVPSFGQRLGEHGYRTGFFTANPAVGKHFGIEGHFEHVSWKLANAWDFGPALTDEFLAWAEVAKAAEGAEDAPLCAYLHYYPPHGPYDPAPEHLAIAREAGPPELDHLADHHRSAELSLGNSLFGRIPWYQGLVDFSTDPAEYITRYEAHIRGGDALVADLVERFGRARPGERTVFVVTSDHGECLGEHGHFFDHGRLMAEGILHVPLLVHDTAEPRGAIVPAPVSQLDIASSVLQLAGLDERLGTLGRRIFRPEAEPVHDGHPVVSQDEWAAGDCGWALRVGRWRLLYNDGVRYGTGHVYDVRTPFAPGERKERLALDVPATALRAPFTLVDGVRLASLALHGEHFEAGREHGVSGRAELAPGRAGTLELRLRLGGDEPGPAVRIPLAAGANTIDGALPALAATAEDVGRTCLFEARFQAGDDGEPSAWRRLLAFPLCVAQRVNPTEELLGAHPCPRCVPTGARLHVTCVWRNTSEPPADRVVTLRLLDADGAEVLSQDRAWFDPLTPEAERRPLRAPRRGYDHEGKVLRFDERLWVRLPEELAPGEYRIELRFAERGDARAAEDGSSAAVIAGRLRVVADADEAFEALVREEAGVEHLRVLDALPPASAAPRLEALAATLPDEGHPHHLLGMLTGDAGGRLAHLRACLDRTPGHRAALQALSELAPEDARLEPARELLPEHGADHVFGDLLRVFGLQVACTTDRRLVVPTLHWEALASRMDCYAGELRLVGTDAAGAEQRSSIWWFLGGHVRATSRWHLGEALAEKVALELPEGTREFELLLGVYPRWRHCYSDLRAFGSLEPRGEHLTLPRPFVQLGRFSVDELPLTARHPRQTKRHSPRFLRLFDLAADPRGTRDLEAAEPRAREALHALLQELIERGEDAAGLVESAEVTMSAEQRKQLRDLGYAE